MNLYKEKQDCWYTLKYFKSDLQLPRTIIVGDLNIMLAPNEKKGGVVEKDFFHDTVEALIHSLDIIDFKPKKG